MINLVETIFTLWLVMFGITTMVGMVFLTWAMIRTFRDDL